MNTNLRNLVYPVIVALSLGAAFAAHAEITPDDSATQVWSMTKTRNQVKNELVAARAQGLLTGYGEVERTVPALQSRLTREEVRAQTAVERAQGKLNWMVGEDSGSFVLSQQWTARPVTSQTLAKAAN